MGTLVISSEISASSSIESPESDATTPDGSVLSKRRIRSLASAIAAAFGTFGFFAIQGILLARLLGPEGRGAYATIVAYPQMFLYMGLLGSADIFARLAAKLPASAGDSAARRAAMRYGLTTGIVTAAVCVLLAWFALPVDKRYLAPLASLVALTLPLQHIRLAVQGVDHGRGYFYRLSSLRAAAAAFFPLLLLGMWLAGWSELRDVTWAFVGSCVAGLLLCQVGMRGSWFGPPQQSVLESLSENRGLAISQIAAELLDRADQFLILFLGTLTDQGFYTSAIPIASTMIIVPNALALFSFRHGADPNTPLTAAGVTRFIALMFAGQIATGCLLAIVIPYAVPILYTQAFTGTVMFAWYLLPSGGLRGMLMTADGYLRGRGMPTPGIIGRIVALMILIGLTFALQPRMGIWSIPVALAAGQFVCLVIVFFAMYRQTQANSQNKV
ncbi:lipopolysaccharide biosynthesis protein [Rosistilla oblonga]|uniref:lipopolysaccharide biosynthesis protein n=1 Tax=Rosistilla oblonga TaxID=2527990 RepID=UPI003A97F03A